MQEPTDEEGVTNSVMDPLRDLFRKIHQHNERLRKYYIDSGNVESYMLLVQHSLSTELRLQQFSQSSTSNTSDEQVYRHAGLLTPWEIATKDLQAGELWMKHITKQLILSCPAQSTILLCATTPNTKSWIQGFRREGQRVVILDSFAEDPWGWDSEGSSTSINLNSLDNLLHLIAEKAKSESTSSIGGIVFESLTPLIQRHGATRVQAFLSRLTTESTTLHSPILVAPILSEMVSSAQHQQFEDMAQSMLCLEGGHATWLRQGVRERGNLVRQALDYNIVESNKDHSKRIQILSVNEGSSSDGVSKNTKTTSGDDDTADTATSAVKAMSVSDAKTSTSTHEHSHSHSHQSERKGRSKKVQLSYSDDGRKGVPQAPPDEPAPAPAPRIYMEENDPEFEDYDEEDPDDDLDI